MSNKITLLDIHKRRLQKLQEKRAKVGIQAEASVDMEIEDIQEQIDEIKRYLNRRLHELKLKVATHGINVDPAVTIEIEDIEEALEE